MSNVIDFPAPLRQAAPSEAPAQGLAPLIAAFAEGRRDREDVFWLKENAELLSILNCTGARPGQGALAPYAPLMAEMAARLHLFPQYYRFLLSLCLDLEDLGLGPRRDPGLGERLCAWVAREGLPGAELSDLQRAEARCLLARRGAARPLGEDALGDRLRAFSGRPATFALPNRKAAYELTHIVFYLSDYGRRDPGLSPEALVSLDYAGLLAFLDQNLDLLAEVCTALRLAGRRPSPIWCRAVARGHGAIPVLSAPEAPLQDAYHLYLVTGWAQRVAGAPAFAPLAGGALRFAPPPQGRSALPPLSACLRDLGARRSADWGAMRGHVLSYLGAEGHALLYKAERSSPRFGEFFEGFARAAR